MFELVARELAIAWRNRYGEAAALSHPCRNIPQRYGIARCRRPACKAQTCALRRQDSELAKHVAIDLQHGRIDQNLRLCLVDVFDDLFRDGDTVCRVAHDDGIHRRALREIPHIEERSKRRDRFRDFRRRDAVRQVDRLEDHVHRNRGVSSGCPVRQESCSC